jgi:hypothetical protein
MLHVISDKVCFSLTMWIYYRYELSSQELNCCELAQRKQAFALRKLFIQQHRIYTPNRYNRLN